MSLATLWLRTKVDAPLDDVFSAIAVALSLLFVFTRSIWVVLVFPAWVLLVSSYILIVSFRRGGGGRGGMASQTPSRRHEPITPERGRRPVKLPGFFKRFKFDRKTVRPDLTAGRRSRRGERARRARLRRARGRQSALCPLRRHAGHPGRCILRQFGLSECADHQRHGAGRRQRPRDHERRVHRASSSPSPFSPGPSCCLPASSSWAGSCASCPTRRWSGS